MKFADSVSLKFCQGDGRSLHLGFDGNLLVYLAEFERCDIGVLAAAAGGTSMEEEEVEEDEDLSRCHPDEGSFDAKLKVSCHADQNSGKVSLREWLDNPNRSVNSEECIHIFRQVAEVVNLAHNQKVVVNNIRPSCFVMSSFNRVSFIESASCSDSDSEEEEDCGNAADIAIVNQWTSVEQRRELDLVSVADERRDFPLKKILSMEFNWYASPEEAEGRQSTFTSDIYKLGILLFELFCTFETLEEKLGKMSNLRDRVLPPQMLLKWPKEASFCLWLLHPLPSSRPTMRYGMSLKM